eukprot:scaffold1766_cov401-Prasinococcus_capsulatus_cf.AAC.18
MPKRGVLGRWPLGFAGAARLPVLSVLPVAGACEASHLNTSASRSGSSSSDASDATPVGPPQLRCPPPPAWTEPTSGVFEATGAALE